VHTGEIADVMIVKTGTPWAWPMKVAYMGVVLSASATMPLSYPIVKRMLEWHNSIDFEGHCQSHQEIA